MAVCELCHKEMLTGASCVVEVLHQDGVPLFLDRVRRRCDDCGVKRGGLHHLGCDMQRCPCCGRQLISCGCWFDEDGPLEDDEELEA